MNAWLKEIRHQPVLWLLAIALIVFAVEHPANRANAAFRAHA